MKSVSESMFSQTSLVIKNNTPVQNSVDKIGASSRVIKDVIDVIDVRGVQPIVTELSKSTEKPIYSTDITFEFQNHLLDNQIGKDYRQR